MEGEASEVERSLEALYGRRTLLARGVVHVTAARAAEGALRVIPIGEGAPKSATDFFVLNLCRARADAILTTAENLRAEPRLHHALQGGAAPALACYRREVLGKSEPPACAILTRSGDLPLSHPVWTDGTAKLVLSSRAPRESVQRALGGQVRFVTFEDLDARGACAFLRSQGYGLISVEAGPSTARSLYGADSAVDELLLSLYEGPRSDVPLGPALPPLTELTRGRVCTADHERDEESGRWRFQRWLRDPRESGVPLSG